MSSITLAELPAGVLRLPDGQRKEALARRIEKAVQPYRGSRSLLVFDGVAAERCPDVLMAREAAGVPISTADAQIAAIRLANNAACATRNVKDFAHTGLKVIVPWAETDD